MNFLTGLAPSIAAAKNGSLGNDNKPANKSRNINGVHCQTSTIITVNLAKAGSVNHFGDKPKLDKISLTGPKDSWKKVLQITVIITGVVIIGTKNKTLKNLLNLMSFQTICARANPITYWRITVVTDKKLNLKKDSQNLGSSVKSRI